MERKELLARLLRSREPSIRWKARTTILREDERAPALGKLRDAVREAPRTRALLRTGPRPGRVRSPPGVYSKWLGDHWVFASLADLGYPAGDAELEPRMREALRFWLRPDYFREFVATSEKQALRLGEGVPKVEGRYRRCASQQGNALFYATVLGFRPEDCDRLAERLMHWQWPDGGWNCDRNPSAETSSFAETLLPMTGLFAYAARRDNAAAFSAARRASEVFLRRRLLRRVSDGTIIRSEFTHLHYPLYWHYDFLGCLKALGPMGLLSDPRCQEALDLLESKELPRGGWKAEARYYNLEGEKPRRGSEKVEWGPTGRGMNEWVSADALSVLRSAGRFRP